MGLDDAESLAHVHRPGEARMRKAPFLSNAWTSQRQPLVTFLAYPCVRPDSSERMCA